MTTVQWLVVVSMSTSSAEAAYLLWLLNSQLRTIYGSIRAWRFIFAGFILMFVEILMATAAGLPWAIPRWLRVCFILGFCGLMVLKVTSYVIGFTLWARARQRLLDPKRWTPKAKE